MLPGLAPNVGSLPVVASFANYAVSGADLASYSLSISNLIGSGRRIVGVAGRAASTRTITGVQVDGLAATPIGFQDNAGTTVGLFLAPATANTIANVTVNLSASWLRCSVAVWNLLNLKSDIATASGGDNTATSSALDVALNVLAGGAAFAIAYDVGSAPNFAWLGLDENFDVTMESGHSASGAFATFASAQSPLNIKATLVGNSDKALFAASFR